MLTTSVQGHLVPRGPDAGDQMASPNAAPPAGERFDTYVARSGPDSDSAGGRARDIAQTDRTRTNPDSETEEAGPPEPAPDQAGPDQTTSARDDAIDNSAAEASKDDPVLRREAGPGLATLASADIQDAPPKLGPDGFAPGASDGATRGAAVSRAESINAPAPSGIGATPSLQGGMQAVIAPANPASPARTGSPAETKEASPGTGQIPQMRVSVPDTAPEQVFPQRYAGNPAQAESQPRARGDGLANPLLPPRPLVGSTFLAPIGGAEPPRDIAPAPPAASTTTGILTPALAAQSILAPISNANRNDGAAPEPVPLGAAIGTPESFPGSNDGLPASLTRADAPPLMPAPPAFADFTLPRPETARLAAAQAVELLARQPDTTVEITLNPEELGRVRMALSGSDTGVTVTISAERPETLELMRRHIEQLAQEFRRLGYAEIGFEFTGRGPNHFNPPQAGAQRDGEPTHEATENPIAPSAKHLASAGLDLRL